MIRPAIRRLVAILGAVALLAGGLPSGAGGQVEPRASLPQLEEEVMCLVCGTLLGLSRAPAAERQRAFMRELIREGRTEQQVKAALVAEYGPQVLAIPEGQETNLFVRVLPVVGLVAAAMAVLGAALMWQRRRDRDPPTPARPDGAAAERLEQDLDRFGE